jgi:DNA invertase Pin-like site-specific DNA recombinase
LVLSHRCVRSVLWISVGLQIQLVSYSEEMSAKHIAIYARVSSSGQDLAAQEPDLLAWVGQYADGCEVVWYRDSATGATFGRPGMEALEGAVRSRRVDAIVVWRLDRLGRTAAQTLAFLSLLDEVGVQFTSIRDGFDARSATGRLLRTILAGFAEYEREVISERIRAGISAAKAQGKHWGGRRPGYRPTLTPSRLQVIQTLLDAGTSKTEIAKQLRISRSTVYQGASLIAQRGRNAPPTVSTSAEGV